MAQFPAGSCLDDLLLHDKLHAAKHELQLQREERARRRVEDGLSIEDWDHYDFHYKSDREDEEDTSSFILNDCAPQHCHVVSSSLPPVVPPSQSRPPPPNAQPAAAVSHHQSDCRASHAHITDRPSDPVPCRFRWDIALLRALRGEPISNRREAGKKREPGRVDMNFIPKKGDLIIHHDRKQWRRVLEFYDPTYQRLHDGDILIRIRIDSYSCFGIILMKGIGYMYHRGYWMFLGTDSDQISQYFQSR